MLSYMRLVIFSDLGNHGGALKTWKDFGLRPQYSEYAA